MDTDNLLKALENEENEKLFNLTTEKIQQMNLDILKELHLTKDDTLHFMKKLREYRYVEEINDLNYGAYLRWIPIDNPDNIDLKGPGMLCDIKITDNGTVLLCKNFAHKHFQFKMDESLIFQKISNQEKVLLSALDHLSHT